MYKLPENEELLLHYLSGLASDEEKKTIFEWINLSKENKEYFDKVKADYILMVQASRANLISENNFTSILDRIKKRRRMRLTIAAAVSLSLVLFFGISLSLQTDSSTDVLSLQAVAVAETSIRPGSQTAILELSSGEQIDLSTTGNQLKDGSGTAIKIDEAGEISYHAAAKSTSSQAAAKILKYNKLTIPRGGEYMIKLSDGTQVWLNSDSELRYPVEFHGDSRTVYLKGEAYFDVAKDASRPFRVNVGEVHLTVLGTSFNVNTHNANSIETVLVSGSVEVDSKSARRVLKPNERGLVQQGSSKIAVDVVDVQPFIAWKNGDFVFHRETLGDIMNKLSRWYNVEVEFRSGDLRGIKLSGEMSREAQIYDLLYFFEKISDVKFTVKEGTVIVNERKRI